MKRCVLICALLAACGGDLPTVDAAVSPAARAQGFPVLVPLDDILSEADQPSRAKAAEGALRARGANLARRGIASPGTGDLAARGRQLRARAAELRAVDI